MELVDLFAAEKGYNVLMQRVSQTEKPIGWLFIRYNLWFACAVRHIRTMCTRYYIGNMICTVVIFDINKNSVVCLPRVS